MNHLFTILCTKDAVTNELLQLRQLKKNRNHSNHGATQPSSKGNKYMNSIY